jgi:hypothetical protein
VTENVIAHDQLPAGSPAQRTGRRVFAAALGGLLLIAAPIVWRGAPLADDFNNCVASRELGLAGFLAVSWHQLGLMRPARFLEILLTGAVCRSLPFGVAIAVPLILTVVVAVLVSALLRDLGIPRPWAAVGGAFWLLQPLGTETALWPAALHVPLGLALALVALRLYRRGRFSWAAMANAAAALSVEQVILPLPLAAWAVAPRRTRKYAAAISAAVGLILLVSFALWPGANPRLRVTLLERISGVVANPSFYLGYPAVGLGLHSIPLAIRWALPWSGVVLAFGIAVGWTIGPRLTSVRRETSRAEVRRAALIVAGILMLTNVIVVLAVPQQGSPRVFSPSWLVLALAAPAAAACVRWRHSQVLGALGGLFAAGAILSLAFSADVRLQSADFTVRASRLVAARVGEGGTVQICGVRRTVVEPAPRGAFAVHDFIYEWSAERAVSYYTGRHVTIQLAGELWNRGCSVTSPVQTVIDFDQLLAPDR